ncbi:c-type cytochrome [Faunimonas sp. B44]|uniref:c-type cytochrome n=1 Tax=Faunimonas sp. B44 TaxID=3461493 RepID=UPI004043CAA8
MRRSTLFAGALACAALAAGPANAAGDAARGEKLAAPCVTCHGSNGIATMPNFPNLAGQNAQYIVLAIKAYQEGKRTGGNAALMIPMAKLLSDQDAQDVAAYFSAMGKK